MADADIIVAGGGPVGLATAIEARLAGFRVIVVEPRDSPIDKACGEGLMPGAVGALRRLGVEPGGQPLAGIAYVDARLRAEHRFLAGTARGVRRTVLHATMVQRAEALGVQSVVGKVEAFEQDGCCVRVGVRGSGSLVGGWLIGCDGLHSTIRRLAGLQGGIQRPDRRRFGLRRHFRIAPWSELIEVYWTGTVEAYVTPVGPDTVGVAILGPRRADYARALGAVPGLGERLAGADVDSSILGAGPMRQRSVRRAAGRVLLAGDASGYVDALTGEGLRVGFAQARAAVQSIGAAAEAAASGGRPFDVAAASVARSYEHAWRQSTRDFRVITGGLVAAARSPLRGRIVPASVASPRLFGAIVERLAR